jgi:hypothetical protein
VSRLRRRSTGDGGPPARLFRWRPDLDFPGVDLLDAHAQWADEVRAYMAAHDGGEVLQWQLLHQARQQVRAERYRRAPHLIEEDGRRGRQAFERDRRAAEARIPGAVWIQTGPAPAGTADDDEDGPA